MKMSLKPNDCNFAHGMVCSSVYLKYVGDAAKLRAGEKKYYFKFCMGLDIDSEKEGNKWGQNREHREETPKERERAREREGGDRE